MKEVERNDSSFRGAKSFVFTSGRDCPIVLSTQQEQQIWLPVAFQTLRNLVRGELLNRGKKGVPILISFFLLKLFQ